MPVTEKKTNHPYIACNKKECGYKEQAQPEGQTSEGGTPPAETK